MTEKRKRKYRTRRKCRWWSDGWCGVSRSGCEGVWDGCGWEKKPKRRSRHMCRWYDEASEFCGVPQEVPGRPVKNSIIHWSVRCQGVRNGCGYEERKEAQK